MKTANIKAVFELIRQNPGIPRNEIARRSKLSPATVTILAEGLISGGIVVEQGAAAATGDMRLGRRPTGLDLNPAGFCAIGMELVDNGIQGGVYSLRNECLLRRDHACDSLREDLAGQIIAYTRSLMAELQGQTVIGVCIGVSGIVDVRRKTVVISVPMKLENADLGSAVEQALGLPVMVENEARLAGLYARDSSFPTAESLIYISVGKGLGSSMILNDHTAAGYLQNGGEIGHTSINMNGPMCFCGNRGCLELYAGKDALINAAEEAVRIGRADGKRFLSPGGRPDIASIRYAAENGDRIARELIRESARHLGIGITSLVNIFNPAVVVVGGEMSGLGGQYLSTITDYVKTTALKPYAERLELHLEESGGQPVASGAALLVVSELIESVFAKAQAGA